MKPLIYSSLICHSPPSQNICLLEIQLGEQYLDILLLAKYSDWEPTQVFECNPKNISDRALKMPQLLQIPF